MLEIRLKPSLRVAEFTPGLLQKNHLVTFSSYKDWPDHCRGKTFQVLQKQETTYQIPYTLPGNDYRDINLSNQEAGVKLYPTGVNRLTELAIGWKEGEYLIQPQFPAGYPIYRLDYESMIPKIDDAALRWLGCFTPDMSPDDDPRVRLYLVHQLNPIIFRTYVVAGVDFEKTVMVLTANRCILGEITQPTKEQLARALTLYYLAEMKI